MRITKNPNPSEYTKISHNRFTCDYVKVKEGKENKIKNLTFVKMAYGYISFQHMSESTARAIGEMFIKIADDLKQ